MKLKQLLNRITPLPWRKRPSQTKANEAYALHAANTLPELLAAAKNLRENWEHNLTIPMAWLNEAIALAEDVSTKESRPKPRKRG